jgi:hypothetical protein
MEESIRNIRLEKLIEREKELNCLYSIESLLINEKRKLEYILQDLVKEVPPGWQYPTVCECRITLEGKEYQTEDFATTEYMMASDIVVGEHVAGKIEVAYTQLIRLHKGSAFLPEEQKLLNTISGTIGRTVFRRKLRSTIDYVKSSKEHTPTHVDDDMILNPDSDHHWKWRYEMVEKIAAHLDLDRFGLKGLYLIGSTKNAIAGPGSDIDLIAHSTGDPELTEKLRLWLEGWGYCLGAVNCMKTGYQCDTSMIDLHVITDEDIRKKTSYARMINAVTDGARPIKVKNDPD